MQKPAIALITGASRGLGRDTALQLARKGNDVILTFRSRADEAAAVVKDIEAQGRKAVALELGPTQLAAFGAFVDVGVHQDGLVHVSELADRFIKDPHEVVKAGDIVKVRVVEVDAKRKRIALSMKKESSGPREPREDRNRSAPMPAAKLASKPQAPSQGAFGAALMEAMKKK